jgi:tetratricopeptide (TPR) repeat protein
MCCLTVAAAVVFQVSPWGQQRSTNQAPAPLEITPQASRPALVKPAASPQLPAAPARTAGLQHAAREKQNAYIQMALADYAAGRIDSARETLKILVAPGPQTPAAAQAGQMLSMLDEIQETHARALKAQAQKKFTQALEDWDRLMALDLELIGDRPSHFAAQAEQRVQGLSYEYALDAFRQKNHHKARQLCRVILQIDPQHKPALELLAKIDSVS